MMPVVSQVVLHQLGNNMLSFQVKILFILLQHILFPSGGMPKEGDQPHQLQVDFVHRHVEDTILVLNKGPFPHPWCKQFNMFISQGSMDAVHLGTIMCTREL